MESDAALSRRLDDTSRRVDGVINNTSFGQIQDYRKLDFSNKIRNREDREFAQRVVATLFDLESENGVLKVQLSTALGSIIVAWAEGMVGNIDLNWHAKVMNLPHPVPGFKGIRATYVAPHKPGNPERFVVEINSCAGKEQGGDIDRLLLDNKRSRSRQRSSSRRYQREHSPQRRSLSRSPSPPPRRSQRRPPVRDRSPRRRSSSSRSSSGGESSDSEPGIISRVLALPRDVLSLVT